MSKKQAAIFQRVGESDYRIPPDRVLSPQAAAAIGARYQPGLTVADAGYPNGIPVVIQREAGVGG
ncbi:hypothetical protein [Aliidiomarina soli]|uniref:hypothetical protein n=1 Tax=Aliidiomarina soli TaxID=1928574 RepID=UPI000F86902F|nr:hypothetical protein [Aliidiomarina soli]